MGRGPSGMQDRAQGAEEAGKCTINQGAKKVKDRVVFAEGLALSSL